MEILDADITDNSGTINGGTTSNLVGMIRALPTYAVVKVSVLSVSKIVDLGKYKEKIADEPF